MPVTTIVRIRYNTPHIHIAIVDITSAVTTLRTHMVTHIAHLTIVHTIQTQLVYTTTMLHITLKTHKTHIPPLLLTTLVHSPTILTTPTLHSTTTI